MTTAVAVVAGVLGSVYSREIALAFPLSSGPYEEISPRAVPFWCSLLVFAPLFFGRQMHEERARRELIVGMDGTDTIQKRIQTLPPKGFLRLFVVTDSPRFYAHVDRGLPSAALRLFAVTLFAPASDDG